MSGCDEKIKENLEILLNLSQDKTSGVLKNEKDKKKKIQSMK